MMAEADADIHKFPIPMRGNEFKGMTLVRTTAFEFPIPMRGNENAQAIGYATDNLEVSDPHEG